jgi:4-amino-4-deoxy-L-arabinose transferase-like glycosyltransferase
MPAESTTTVAAHANRWSRNDLLAAGFLMVFVSIVYGARMTARPLVGEETRWATGAREMLATGDWIVPRQQGQVFPERPPMAMWMMAAAGWFRGDVDLVATRLPSVVAVVLTSLLIFFYTRTLFSTFAATVAGLSYATMGQVLQIGRQGECEALFALFLGASLLVWHLGYMRRWRPLVVWTAGFALAALAALVKGPQAPVYFVAITGYYLLVRRDLRYLFRWEYAVGAASFAAIIALWQLPFYLATDLHAVVATWSGLATDRIRFSGVVAHAVTYPADTFACVLPWSPILLALISRKMRLRLLPLPPGECPVARNSPWRGEDALSCMRSVTVFILTSIVVAYPTVWLAAGARGRYFMPLYPLIAVLIGLVVEQCSSASYKTYPRRAWHQFLLVWVIVIGTAALIVGGAAVIGNDLPSRLYQPRWFGVAFAILAATAACLIWMTYWRADKFKPLTAVIAIASVASVGATGILININAACWIDPAGAVVALKNQLPAGAKLVSFSPIEHRFAYYYRDVIGEFNWPLTTDQVPEDVEYFCFMRTPGDTAMERAAGRGRTWYKTPGTLPFEWQEITSVCVERQVYDDNPRVVVLGKVIRPLCTMTSDVTIPQSRMQRLSERPQSITRQ